MQNNFRFWSYHNYLDKAEHENEDNIRFIQGHNVHKLAVADGAGGVGIYCKNWSKKLVESIPESFEAVNQEWFIARSKEFFEDIMFNIPSQDLFVKEKFVNKGSYSTLLYAWIDQTEKKLYCLGLGDTYLFLFRKKDNKYSLENTYPNNSNSSIGGNPNLLNWRLEVSQNAFEHKEFDLQSSDIIITCTDSIARWLFMHLYLFNPASSFFSEGPSSEDLELFKKNSTYSSIDKMLELITSLESEEDFKILLLEEVKKELLEPDDFTLFFYTV